MRDLTSRYAWLAASLLVLSACDDGDPDPDGGDPDSGVVDPDGGVPGTCDDGVIDPGEACDDQNDDDGDGCSSSCEVEAGFTCTGEPSVCETVCGDGVVAGMEACDDGGEAANDGCSPSCEVEPGFTCTGEPSVCETVCGDGVVTADEACDDGNTDDLDGCDASCEVEAGVMCTGEPSVCTATCGDGVVATIEGCDDGNPAAGDGCSDTCQVERGFSCAGEPSTCMTGCGDGIVAGTEGCDDGDMDDGDGCSRACRIERGYSCTGEPSMCETVCGDGIVAATEGCDDGNSDAMDGCSDMCMEETGYTCTGEPSACEAVCGDGVVAAGAESCDDGNLVQGDGCGALCQEEFGFTCTGAPSACALGETVAQVALGGEGGCVRTVSGRVGCFGDNSESSVGNGTDNVETFLPADTLIADATLVVAGDEHHCALRAGGTVWCWGDNNQRQQGIATTSADQDVPQQIGVITGIVSMDAGADFNCVIDGSGAVACWGDNDNRQLGQGTSRTDSETPLMVTLPAGRTATALALGANHACALLDDATVACWGDDGDGQLGDGTSGTDNGTATVVAGLTSVAQVAAGGDTTCARDMAGAVQCWGDNVDGQLADGGTTDRATPGPVTLPATADDVAVGNDYACALLSNDEVWCWGESNDYQTGVGTNVDQTAPGQVRGLGGLSLVDVEAGSRGACALTTAGDRFCWGYSEAGQLGIFSRNALEASPVAFTPGFTGLTASVPEYRGQLCATYTSGAVECAGTNDEVSRSTTTGAIGVFPGFSEHIAPPRAIPALTGVVEGSFGDNFACARTSAAVLCVGDNDQEQLGQGGAGPSESATPLPVTGLGAVDEIDVGESHACARIGGEVRCWGDNDQSQTGVPGSTDQGTPVALSGLTDAVQVDLGDDHGCALRSGGGVVCWGDNSQGQLGTGTSGTDSATPTAVVGLPGAASAIVVGEQHSCALVGNEVFCWGENDRGQLGQGTTADSATPLSVLTGASAIASGNNYVCAIVAAGAVRCWGYGLDGHLGNGGQEVTGTDNFLSPVDWRGVTGATGVVAGNSVTCVETASGWGCAGFRADGQLGDGTTLNPTLALPASTL